MPLLLFIIIILFFPGCKDEPVPPEVPKDPRTYSWSVDTLAYLGSFQTSMFDIWGSSPNDVYVVGHNDRGYGKMFHFDGTSWKDVVLYFPDEHGVASIDLSAIYGFAKNDIWAVGERIHDNPTPPPNFLDSSLVLHYDGVSWKEHRLQKGRYMLGVWGTSSSNLWTCGLDKQIFHFNGSLWSKESVQVVIPQGQSFGFADIVGVGSRFFAVGSNTNNAAGTITFYYFERKNTVWVPVDSFLYSSAQLQFKWGVNKFWVSPKGTLYSVGGGGVFKWENGTWQNIFPHETVFRNMFGTSDQNIFVAGDFGKLYHYNGTDWHQFKQFENDNIVYHSIWSDVKEVFVVGETSDGQKSLILRGK